MKEKPGNKSLITIYLIMLLMILLLPIIISVFVDLFISSQLNPKQLYINLFVASLSMSVLAYPTYLTIKNIKETESKTSETQRNVAELIDHAADMILITRLDGRITQANQKAIDLLGYSSEELLQMNTMDIDLDSIMYRTPKLHTKLFRGEAVTFDTYYRAKDGSRIPVENHITNAGWITGTHYLEIARDITRRREVEQQLHDSKEALERVRNRLETRMQERTEELVEEVRMRELTEKQIFEIRLLLENLVNSMPSAIIALDDTLRITQWNLEAEKVFGVVQSSAIDQNITQLLPEFRDNIIQLIRDSEFGSQSFTQVIDINLNNANHRFSVMLYPLSRTTGSDAPGVVIRLDDITEKTRFDEMLVQTEKMMSLGGLAAGMAHEINNPLGAILQSTQNIWRRLLPNFSRNQQVAQEFGIDLELLNRYLEKQKINQSLSAIQEAGERASTIVSDMLSFARPSESKPSAVNVIEALQSSIRLAEKDYNQKRQYDFRNIAIVQSYQNDLPMVYAQRNQLNQVFLNLLINAAQALAYSNKLTKPKIEVSAELQDNYIKVVIKDNGPGIDEETRRRVFEPFFTTKPEGSGTGLGLSVSYFIVTEQLGGRLTVESTLEQETSFIIHLPYIEDVPKIAAKADEQIQLPLDPNT